MVRVLPDPPSDSFEQVPLREPGHPWPDFSQKPAHLQHLLDRAHANFRESDVEVRISFFDNLGRNESVLDSFEFESVSLRQIGEVAWSARGMGDSPMPEVAWSYMVKRISANGGCLGSQRR